MHVRRLLVVMLMLAVGAAAAPRSLAQEQTLPVPDLTGLNSAQAAALLNSSGLMLGLEMSTGLTGLDHAPNTIVQQSIAPGERAAPGARVDVVIARADNLTLVYDENDLTLINRSADALDLSGIAFGVAEGSPASFNAVRWTSQLPSGQCTQIWSIARSAPKDVEGCSRFASWLSTRDSSVHFWTAAHGVVSFNVVQNGMTRAVCPAAAVGAEPIRCDVYVEAAAGDIDSTPYIYFAYTADRLIVFNRSSDQWMPVAGTVLYNFNPNLMVAGSALLLGDASLYSARSPVADLARLAPGQCLLFTNGQALETVGSPQACFVTAQLDIDPNLIFWAAPFELVSQSDGQRRRCPAAVAGRITLCILPR